MIFKSSVNDKFYKRLKNKGKELENNKEKIQNSKNLIEEQNKFLTKLSKGDPKIRQKFTNALVENVTIAIPAQTMFGQFFEMGNFTPDRRSWYYPVEENDVDIDNEVEVYRIYRNGNAPRAEVLTDETYVQVQPYQITSKEYYMDKFALELGIIEEPTRLYNKASANIAWKLEDDAETILTNGLYDDINTINGIEISDKISNFPSSNDLDLSSYGGVTLNTFKDIAVYAKRIGQEIEAIYAPVSVETDMWDWLDVPEQYDGQDGNPPTELIPTVLREKLVTEGVPGQLFGRNFNIQSVNTLNDDATEDAIYMWIKFSGGGSGHLRYLQGGNFSDEYSHEDANRLYYNLKKTLMMFQTPKQRVNYARVKIQDKA
jgi:hypothetical protein